MNGMHDLGGMHGFGQIEIEPDEPLFHDEWEGRARAMTMLSPFNLDEMRFFIEDVSPQDYLRTSYFEKWLNSTQRSWVEHGFLTGEEIDARVAELAANPHAPMPAWPGPNPDRPPMEKYVPTTRPSSNPVFAIGDAVRVRNEHPAGHTRSPRYVRGKRGVIARMLGPQIFPDTNAHGLGHHPQPVYNVVFAARELWGAQAEPNQTVSVDLWESYLEQAE